MIITAMLHRTMRICTNAVIIADVIAYYSLHITPENAYVHAYCSCYHVMLTCFITCNRIQPEHDVAVDMLPETDWQGRDLATPLSPWCRVRIVRLCIALCAVARKLR